MFQEEIFYEEIFLLERQQAVNQDENITSDEDEPMDVDTTRRRLQASNVLVNVYAKSVILEGELSSAEIQAVVGKNYGKLQFPFNNFRNNFKKTYQQQKVSAKPKRQATLNDVFSKASSSN